MDILKKLIHERPSFHKGETEVDRTFDTGESFLSTATVNKLASDQLTCYGIGSSVLSFIAENVHEGSKTLETGAGCSTLVFACSGAKHIAVTPSQSEIGLISKYALANGINMGNVQFVQESSDSFLPRSKEDGFDMVLLDGKHAFPWPVIDWFYTADKLKQGGLMIIDDTNMKPVSMLTDFMKIDKGWVKVAEISGNTIVFRKVRESIHDVAWHMQPYTFANPVNRFGRRLKQLLKI